MEGEFLGIQRRKRHRVMTQPWPWRLVWKASDTPPEREVNRWIGWANPQVHLWLEWRRVANTSDHLYAEWLVRACYAKRNLHEPFDGHFEEPSAEQATYMSFEEFSEKDEYNQRTKNFAQILAARMAELERVKNEKLESDVKVTR